jgi:hypothetical protein
VGRLAVRLCCRLYILGLYSPPYRHRGLILFSYKAESGSALSHFGSETLIKAKCRSETLT